MDTIGNLVDKLSIVNLKIWMLEDVKREMTSSDADVASATRKTNVLNCQRNDLIQEIDESINELVTTGKPQKLYDQGSTKMYGRRGR